MEKFEEFINSETPVLVDYFAAWCGPCKMMHPILDELKERLGDKVRILKIDVDVPANRQSVYAYQIQSVPTLMLFKKGRMLWRQSGVVRVPRLEEIIKPYLASQITGHEVYDYRRSCRWCVYGGSFEKIG